MSSTPFDRPLTAEAVSDLGRDAAVSPQAGDEERVVESALRPHSLGDFIGQPKVARQLALVLEGAKRRGRPPDGERSLAEHRSRYAVPRTDGRPTATQAWNPPTTSVARCSPRDRSASAARLDV